MWSTTKTVTNLAALMLVDRGLLDPFAPVARYWPEFAENGKEHIEVRHLMSHTSGVSGWDAPFTIEDMYDWELSTSRLAAQKPWWEPGTASGYHANNQGHLLGELVRRVTGQPLKAFVADEIAGPLGADFQIGAAQADWGRIAPGGPAAAAAVRPGRRSIPTARCSRPSPARSPTPAPPTRPAWRQAELGALNGHANARSVARILRVLALGGTANGVRLLSPDTIGLIFTEQSHGHRPGARACRCGSASATPCPRRRACRTCLQGRTCYWGGWGGSVIIADTDSRTTISYMMNKMGPGIIGSDRSEVYVRTVLDCLA